MKERPILFSAPMVRAILAGTKAQTRRVVKPQPLWIAEPNVPFATVDADPKGIIACPYGQPGDRLWVREAWRIGAWNEAIGCVAIDYKSDGFCRKEWIEPVNDGDGEIFNRLWMQSTDDAIKVYGQRDRYEWEPGKSPCRWRHSIHMPRWASRILLEIVSVRVERVQDIGEADAIAEGVTTIWPDGPRDDKGPNHYTIKVGDVSYNATTAAGAYAMLWDVINGPSSWEANPWVWCISFRRID